MGEGIYRPLIEGMTWSYSRIRSFHDCPYRWFLTYISGETPQPMFYASYGTFLHKLLFGYYGGALTAQQAQLSFLLDFKTEVQGRRPSAQTADKYIRQGSAFLSGLKPLPYRPVALEARMEFQVGSVPFVGIVDYLGEDHGLVIVDHKSRDLRPRSGRANPTGKDLELDDMLRQLYLYAEGVRQTYGEYPARLAFNCFRTGALIEESFRMDACEEAVRWAERSVAEIENAEEFPPHVDYFSCGYLCGVRDACCYCQKG